jgi:hypothetical protein
MLGDLLEDGIVHGERRINGVEGVRVRVEFSFVQVSVPSPRRFVLLGKIFTARG